MEITAFTEFGLIIGLAAVLGIIFTRLRQPAILGYIVCGLIIGPLTPHIHPNEEMLEFFSKVGITFLLFILGLELNFQEVKHLGKVALATGLGQIVFTAIIGYVLSLLLGFSSTASIYIAIALTFSSTIIVIKLLSQKRQLDSLAGRISVGFLLVQDFVAILIIIGLSAVSGIESGQSTLIVSLGSALVKGIIVTILIFLFARYILTPVLNIIRSDREVLFLTVIAWALILAGLMGSKFVGFSIEIGGLLAGISLANRFEHLQIESWTKPLRDFFITIFFVILGLQVNVSSIQEVIVPSILLSVFVLVGNPVIVMIIMGMLGYPRKVSFFTSLAVAQISEFSLLVTKFGFDLGHVNNEVLTLVTLVGGMTMTLSSYLIYYNDGLYSVLDKYLKIFEFRKGKGLNVESNSKKMPIVLFGCHRMGRSMLKMVPHAKDNILIVDYDPKVVKELNENGYSAIYGDVASISLYETFHLDEAQIVVSTVPLLDENKVLLEYISSLNRKPTMIMTGNTDQSAHELYEAGADFVIYPHLLGSETLAHILIKGTITKRIVKIRNKQLEKLNLN